MQPITIKKYANRRLYDTSTSTYITLDDLAEMVKKGEDFVVVDAKSGDDLTRSVLTQIIFEQENNGDKSPLLPISFLRQLIQFYDNSLQTFIPPYLEASMDAFIQNQSTMQEKANNMIDALNPWQAIQNIQNLREKNLEMLQKSMSMFNPFIAAGATAQKDEEIAELKREISELKKQLNK